MTNRIEIGHQGRYWGDDFKNLPYTKQGVTKEEVDHWEKLGYSEKYLKSYTGSMYDNSNTMPDWIKTLENAFGMYNQSYTFYRMETCEIMPVHSDHFRTYSKLNNVSPDQVWRAVMMLEDWKPGHYFELDGVGYVNWKAGDWFKWRGDVPHAASNIGSEPRYSLQVTGVSINTGQLNDLFCFNIPDQVEVLNHPFIRNDILPVVPEKHVMVFMKNGFINELSTIKHDADTIKLLNDEGLHVYLYEPLSSYHLNYPQHTQGFYSEFDSNIDPEYLKAEELDSIYDYAVANKLSNITVHTCDYNVDKWYEIYTSTNRLKLVCDDLFLRTQNKIMNISEVPNNQFIRSFICLNWRFTKHRQLIATFLASKLLSGHMGSLSWYFKADIETLSKDLFFDMDEWKIKHPEHYQKLKRGCEVIKARGPFIVDKKDATPTIVDDPLHMNMYPNVVGYESGENPALFNRMSNNLSDHYFEAFVDIVNETRFAQPTANFSEKVFQPMQYLRPFVVVAPPKTLEYIRSMGFKTFNDFWDESYDNELDHGERLAKIFDLIDHILAMSNEEQRQLYEQMIPVLTHNLNRYKEIILCER